MNPKHLSLSERRILALEQQIAVYEQMRAEYVALLNYLCREGDYEVDASTLQDLEPFLPIRTEIKTIPCLSGSRRVMTFSRVPKNNEPSAPSTRIIRPS